MKNQITNCYPKKKRWNDNQVLFCSALNPLLFLSMDALLSEQTGAPSVTLTIFVLLFAVTYLFPLNWTALILSPSFLFPIPPIYS